jgi:hypothetical protein
MDTTAKNSAAVQTQELSRRMPRTSGMVIKTQQLGVANSRMPTPAELTGDEELAHMTPQRLVLRRFRLMGRVGGEGICFDLRYMPLLPASPGRALIRTVPLTTQFGYIMNNSAPLPEAPSFAEVSLEVGDRPACLRP